MEIPQDKQNMLNEIYKVVADKNPSIGCKYLFGGEVFKICGHILHSFTDSSRVIGHSVMIGDVLDYGNNEYKYNDIKKYMDIRHSTQFDSPEDVILELRENKREPIENQSVECIEYIYNLISVNDHATL